MSGKMLCIETDKWALSTFREVYILLYAYSTKFIIKLTIFVSHHVQAAVYVDSDNLSTVIDVSLYNTIQFSSSHFVDYFYATGFCASRDDDITIYSWCHFVDNKRLRTITTMTRPTPESKK